MGEEVSRTASRRQGTLPLGSPRAATIERVIRQRVVEWKGRGAVESFVDEANSEEEDIATRRLEASLAERRTLIIRIENSSLRDFQDELPGFSGGGW